MKESIGKFERLYPNPVVLVSCSDGKNDNIITLAWVGTVCSDPPLISISIRPSRYSHSLINFSKEFIVNIPDEKMAAVCDFCGTNSGRNVDKFERLNLIKEKPFVVKAPLIKECPIGIECVVRNVIHLGTHDMFMGEVVSVDAEKDVIYSDADIDYNRISTLTYLMGKYFKNTMI
ncbi:MAG: flavin reductase family protein [Actinomycetota bacterium]|nr:flavin reductase family protein [Actinomycetota bacterium]